MAMLSSTQMLLWPGLLQKPDRFLFDAHIEKCYNTNNYHPLFFQKRKLPGRFFLAFLAGKPECADRVYGEEPL